ncbi:MAG: HNH endonuclease [Rhizobiales bacterium]|nr:HNH endonuclease [Hyphomicrobiales bacterium]
MITADRLRELLSYDPETGVFTWRADAGARGRIKAGTVAGCLSKARGVLTIQLDGRLYQAQRLAWLYVTGDHPPRFVGFIDGDHGNLAWKNLRLASQMEANRSMRPRKGRTLPKGVSIDRRGCPVAQIWYNGRCHHLGSFSTIEAAADAYAKAAREHFGEFARVA